MRLQQHATQWTEIGQARDGKLKVFRSVAKCYDPYFNWPKLFHAFSVAFTWFFSLPPESESPTFHIIADENKGYNITFRPIL